MGGSDGGHRLHPVGHPEAGGHVPGVEPAHAVPDQVDRTGRDVPLDVPLEFARAGHDAACATESRDQHAVTGRFELLADAGEVIAQRPAERDNAVVPTQAVNEDDRGVEFRG